MQSLFIKNILEVNNMRAPYNVLVLPYFRTEWKTTYCIFKREDLDVWQFIAGGGEEGEAPIKRKF